MIYARNGAGKPQQFNGLDAAEQAPFQAHHSNLTALGQLHDQYSPRASVWCLGVIVLLLMNITAFIDHVLPWGQIVVISVSALVHIYYVSYIDGGPH